MRKLSTLKPFLIIIIGTLFYGADCSKNTADCHSSFRVNNATNNAIYFSLVFDSTFARINYPPVLSPQTQKCSVNETKLYNTFGCLEGQMNDLGKQYVFIFDSYIIENTPWDTIKKNRLF